MGMFKLKFKFLLTLLAILILMCPLVSFGANITYTYDSLSRVTKVDYGNGFTEEYTYDAAGNRLTMAIYTDTDSDGLPDSWEIANFGNLTTANGTTDYDSDGLLDKDEYSNNTNPKNSDTDGDSMPDVWEVANNLNPLINDSGLDPDGDGYTNLQEYQGGSNPNNPNSIPNQPPIADAGSDRNVKVSTGVMLDGSDSYDPERGTITFQWTFTNVPAGSSITDASLSDATSAKPTFTPDVEGIYTLNLTVSDGALTFVDGVSINAFSPNVPPNADAGKDQNALTGSMVYLDGSKSNDSDNSPQPLSYSWSFVDLPLGSMLTDGSITGKYQANAGFTPDVDGIYEVRLTVSDGILTSEDTVQVIASTSNVAPNADAGEDTTISLGETAVFNASASNDPDNSPQSLTYNWGFVTVPTGSSINNSSLTNANTVSPSFLPDLTGTYVLELMVSDGQKADFDNVAITVLSLAGDINKDEIIDISDVILVLRIALKIDPVQPCSDMNNDGIVDISDVILTLRMALKIDALKACN
jgi:YD repeat-containing protein